jgi:hypothetical protein
MIMSNQPSPASAESQDGQAPLDRRRGKRLRCNRKARWRVSGTRSAGSGKATLYDISSSGLSLAVDALLKCGTILDVSVERAEEGYFFLPQSVRVRHVKALPNGNWLIGCRFIKKLEKEEFEAIVAE